MAELLNRASRNLRSLLTAALAATLLASVAYGASRPTVRGTGGAVSSDEAQATAAGLDILRQGGNAVDAAVATALALAVVEPEAGNLGGGGFAVVKISDNVSFLDFREEAPAAAHRDMYLDDRGEAIANASIIGPLAAGVPGSPDGLYELHRKHGSLPWKAVVEPARRLAADGFVVSSRLHAGLVEEFAMLKGFGETRAVWLPDDQPLAIGSRIRLPDLAATLAAYAEHGPAAITEGKVAEAVVEVSARHGGILSLEDLQNYQPVWREPVRFEAFGWNVASVDLPSSGGILLASSTEQLEELDWMREPRFGAGRTHLLAEAWRRAYADRYLLGDPRTTEATAAEILQSKRLRARASTVERKRATSSESLNPQADPRGVESNDTTHVSVVDAEGNVVALTTTLNGLYGCGLYVPGAGFFLNNEMDDFATVVGQPNLYGLIQGEANAVAAGKRMLSSQTPTIAWRDGDAIAIGGRGGSKIPTATLQVLLSVWLDGDELQAALDRPRVHHQWLPDRIDHEPDALSPETRAALSAMGHKLNERKSLAQVQAVRWRSGGLVEAGADPRGGGGSAGVVDPLP